MKLIICLAILIVISLLLPGMVLWAGESVGTSEQPLGTGPKSPASGKCIQGYVWREARPSDHVCVRPETRAAVAEQNRTRKQRWTSGAYGPQTCTQGYVWREAFANDKVCVTPGFREQTKQDNKAASRRVVK